MSQNPINLAVRFLLELVGLYAFGLWGWTQHAGFLSYLLVIGLPVSAATPVGNFPRASGCKRKWQSACASGRLVALFA